MTSKHAQHCVAVFDVHQDAEAALRQLQTQGFDLPSVSIIGREEPGQEHPIGFHTTGEQVTYWGRRGAFWGTVFGILLAPAFFWLPGIGPVLTGGAIGSMIMGTLEGAAVGAAVGAGTSALAAALTRLGLPKDSIIRYEGELAAGKYLMVASGSAQQVEHARQILAQAKGRVDVHHHA